MRIFKEIFKKHGLSIFSFISLILYKYTKPLVDKYSYLFLILLGFIIYLILYFFIDILFYKFKKNDKELFTSISIGVLLITISREINMKVKRAYKITWWLLLGALFTFIKGFDYEEAIYLTIVLILLRLSKDSFYRKSLPFDWFWTLILALITLLPSSIIEATMLIHSKK